MISLVRNRRKIYVCCLNSDRQSKIKTYDEPIQLFENYHETKSYADVQSFGLDAYKMLRIKTDVEHAKYYHVGDLVYVYTTPPEEPDNQHKTADYEVYLLPYSSLNYTEVILKQRSGRF